MYLSSRGTTPLSTSASISHKGPPPASKTSPGQTDMGGCVRQNPAARIVAAIPQGIRLHASGSRTPRQGLSSFGHPHKGRPGSQVAQFQATTVWRYKVRCRVSPKLRAPLTLVLAWQALAHAGGTRTNAILRSFPSGPCLRPVYCPSNCQRI